jgi:hypothetical protein
MLVIKNKRYETLYGMAYRGVGSRRKVSSLLGASPNRILDISSSGVLKMSCIYQNLYLFDEIGRRTRTARPLLAWKLTHQPPPWRDFDIKKNSELAPYLLQMKLPKSGNPNDLLQSCQRTIELLGYLPDGGAKEIAYQSIYGHLSIQYHFLSCNLKPDDFLAHFKKKLGNDLIAKDSFIKTILTGRGGNIVDPISLKILVRLSRQLSQNPGKNHINAANFLSSGMALKEYLSSTGYQGKYHTAYNFVLRSEEKIRTLAEKVSLFES